MSNTSSPVDEEPKLPVPKKRTVDSDSLSPKNGLLPHSHPPSLSRLLDPSKGDLMSRLDAFLPAMASANAELSTIGAASRQMDAMLVRIGGEGGGDGDGSDDGGVEDGGNLSPSSSSPSGPPMIELNVAVGEFDDSLYDKLGLGEKKKSEPPSSPPLSSTSLPPSTASFISKKLSSPTSPSRPAPPPSSTSTTASSPKKRPKIEVVE